MIYYSATVLVMSSMNGALLPPMDNALLLSLLIFSTIFVGYNFKWKPLKICTILLILTCQLLTPSCTSRNVPVRWRESNAAEMYRYGTELTELMARNQNYFGASQQTYGKVPNFFNCNKNSKKWNPRLKVKVRTTRRTEPSEDQNSSYGLNWSWHHVAGSIYSFRCPKLKRYYIRLLPPHVISGKKFSDILTDRKVPHLIFQESCK